MKEYYVVITMRNERLTPWVALLEAESEESAVSGVKYDMSQRDLDNTLGFRVFKVSEMQQVVK